MPALLRVDPRGPALVGGFIDTPNSKFGKPIGVGIGIGIGIEGTT